MIKVVSWITGDMAAVRRLLFVFICLLIFTFSIMIFYEYTANHERIVNCIQPTTNVPRNVSVTKEYLSRLAIAPRIWHKYPNKLWRGIQLPVLISHPLGRLGNVMGEYATLYALGRIYGTSVRLAPDMRKQLINTFPNLSMELLPGTFTLSEWTPVRSLTFINLGPYEAAASGILGPKLFRLTEYPFEIQLFNQFRRDILNEFTFSHSLQQQVREFWRTHLGNSSVVISIHVRRTDYVEFIKKLFNSRLPDHKYFKGATEYYRKKFGSVRFLVASDDMPFVKDYFKDYSDIVFAPGSPRELDMALLASCNHSIITLGSFGFWCGYLTGGEVVYPNITAKPDYQFQKHWYDFGQLDFFTPIPV